MRTAVNELKVHTVCQMILAAFAVGASLYFLRSVLLPFILALFFVTGVAPVLYWIEKRFQAPRMVAVAIAFLLGILLFTILWLLIWLSVASLLSNADAYRARIATLVEMTEAWLPTDGLREETPPRPPAADGSATGAASDTSLPRTPETLETPGDAAGSQREAAKPGYDFSAFFSQNVGLVMRHLSASLMDLLSSALMVLIFMFFLLLGDSTTSIRRQGVWAEIESGIRNYIVTKTVISIATGVAFGGVLWLFGIPLALVFGLLAFLLNFIPNIGPIIASVLPLPLILLHPDLSVFSMILVIVLTSGIQFVSGNVLEPKIMGESFDLHPVVILLTLMFWGMLWGIVGMFLATPITAALKVFLDQFEPTRPIARWLEGRFE